VSKKTKSGKWKIKNLNLPTPKSLSRYSFSKYHLLIFAFIFACIGGYLLTRSFAVGPPPKVYVSLSGNDSTCVVNNSSQPCASLSHALQLISISGGTIAVSDGEWPYWLIQNANSGGDPSLAVTVSGSRNAKLTGGIDIVNSSFITFTGLSLTPHDPYGTDPAILTIKNSSHDIIINNMLISGGPKSFNRFEAGGRVVVKKDTTPQLADHAHHVIIKNSELSNCGEAIQCVTAGGDQIQILDNDFHDCYDCSFIQGGGSNVTIDGNTFNRTQLGFCYENGGTHNSCNHNDATAIFGGGPWTIKNNWYGSTYGGTADIYANDANPISGLTIQNNIFSPVDDSVIDPLWPTSKNLGHSTLAIRLAAGNITGAVVANNTLMAGPNIISDLELVSAWDQIPFASRPLIANNFLQLIGTSSCTPHAGVDGNYPRGQYFNNVAETVDATCSQIVKGSANLLVEQNPQANSRDAKSYSPTTASLLLINQGGLNPAACGCIPGIDYFGHNRSAAPDIGAVEYISQSDTQSPSVNIVSPTGGVVSGATNISASASDDQAVASVRFYLDGQFLSDEISSLPYSFSWDSTHAANGNHSLTAVAKDLAGNTTTSAAVGVDVENNPLPPDSTPPTVAITDPVNSTTVNGNVNITANASDNVGVGLVQFELDGNPLGDAVASAPFSLAWDTTTTIDGPHTLLAIAYDTAGNSTTSASVLVIVNNHPTQFKAGDLNSDGYVTVIDLSILLSHYGQSGQTLSTGDCDGDSYVTVIDLSILLSHYGT
jgi:hypothetical protein